MKFINPNRGPGPRQPVTCSVDETASLLGVSPRTVQRRIKDGKINSFTFGSRRLILRTELDRIFGGKSWRQGGVA